MRARLPAENPALAVLDVTPAQTGNSFMDHAPPNPVGSGETMAVIVPRLVEKPDAGVCNTSAPHHCYLPLTPPTGARGALFCSACLSPPLLTAAHAHIHILSALLPPKAAETPPPL